MGGFHIGSPLAESVQELKFLYMAINSLCLGKGKGKCKGSGKDKGLRAGR